MTLRQSSVALVLSLAALAAAGPAGAHHSYSAYDMRKTEIVLGTIKDFRWGAPHSYLVLLSKDKSGKVSEMSFISDSPRMWAKQGFAPADFRSGEKVTVSYHPNVNGAPGGALATATLPGGKTYADFEGTRTPGSSSGGPGARSAPSR